MCQRVTSRLPPQVRENFPFVVLTQVRRKEVRQGAKNLGSLPQLPYGITCGMLDCGIALGWNGFPYMSSSGQQEVAEIPQNGHAGQ